MVEIGRGVAGRVPHCVRSPPAEFGGTRQILRQREDSKRAAKSLDLDADDIDPRLDQRGNLRADFHRGELFGRERGQHGGIDMREPGFDHIHRPAGKGERGHVAIDARRVRRQRQCFGSPSVERGMVRQFAREHEAHFIERGVGQYALHRARSIG